MDGKNFHKSSFILLTFEFENVAFKKAFVRENRLPTCIKIRLERNPWHIVVVQRSSTCCPECGENLVFVDSKVYKFFDMFIYLVNPSVWDDLTFFRLSKEYDEIHC